eukprot:TRINITY_DN8727_c0_g1_i1.p2 TRINITY_DN8727_c0_g1~~TRINITY_DN8727_c0_g1_i1.p2  ORF type:complete len:140 (+),score=6.39 TRINITY_DN8727_c0_g1_i1:504-923(+)
MELRTSTRKGHPLPGQDPEWRRWLLDNLTLPLPRMAVHFPYYRKHAGLSRYPEGAMLDGFCWSGGWEFRPSLCSNTQGKLHEELWFFEVTSWRWDDRCLSEQQRHYQLVEAYNRNRQIWNLALVDSLYANRSAPCPKCG